MLFDMLDGISWGWLVAAHFVAIGLIWVPLVYDRAFPIVAKMCSPFTNMLDSVAEDKPAKSGD